LDSAELTAHLERSLPSYMVPAVFRVLPAMPLSANGKIDRRAVAAFAPAADAETGGYVEPRDEVEAAVAGLFAEILGRDRVGVHDDFFSLGGHSLLATRLVAMLRRRFRVELALRELFEAPTVGGVAARVAARLAAAGDAHADPASDPAVSHQPTAHLAPTGASALPQEDTGV
jgi:acyl carrier protein